MILNIEWLKRVAKVMEMLLRETTGTFSVNFHWSLRKMLIQLDMELIEADLVPVSPKICVEALSKPTALQLVC